MITGTLRKLSCLRCLDLTDNWLHGAFPAWLDGLGSLQVLRTGMNDLVGASSPTPHTAQCTTDLPTSSAAIPQHHPLLPYRLPS